MNGTASFDGGYYSPADLEPMSFSAGPSLPTVDWSALDLPLDSPFSGSYSQPPSYASLDYNSFGQPGLTASSSGELSEVEDFKGLGGLSPPIMGQNHFASESSDLGDTDAFRLSTTSSYLSMPQASILASSNLESFDIDTFLKATGAAASVPSEPKTVAPMDTESSIQHRLTVSEAQKLAHAGIDASLTGDIALSVTRDSIDPLWAASFSEHVSYELEADLPSPAWTR